MAWLVALFLATTINGGKAKFNPCDPPPGYLGASNLSRGELAILAGCNMFGPATTTDSFSDHRDEWVFPFLMYHAYRSSR